MKKKFGVGGVAGELEAVEHCESILHCSTRMVKARQMCYMLFESPSQGLLKEWLNVQIAPLFVVI